MFITIFIDEEKLKVKNFSFFIAKILIKVYTNCYGDGPMKRDNIIIGVLIFIVIALGTYTILLRRALSSNFTSINVDLQKEKIVFAGDSITDMYDVNKYYQYDDKLIVNSGISGYATKNILDRFYNVIEQYRANKLFLLIGTNDLAKGISNSDIIANISQILSLAKEAKPDIHLYLQSIYPVNCNLSSDCARHNDDIVYINGEMQKYCLANNITYIDVYSLLVDIDGNLNANYTRDGLHLNDDGYEVVTSVLRSYVEE